MWQNGVQESTSRLQRNDLGKGDRQLEHLSREKWMLTLQLDCISSADSWIGWDNLNEYSQFGMSLDVLFAFLRRFDRVEMVGGRIHTALESD